MTDGSVAVGDKHRRESTLETGAVCYITAMFLGIAASIAVLLGTLIVVEYTGHLPAPPIANNICIDEKLAFMRQQPGHSSNLLVLGSSVAWRNVDGNALMAALDGARPFNGGFCGLRMHQTEFVGDWLLDRLPAIRTVVILASPFDFIGCSVNPTRVFDRKGADDFVFKHEWKWSFYLRYFDPVSMVRNAIHVASMRRAGSLDGLTFTAHGDGPLDTAKSAPTLVYGKLPPRFDSLCFVALKRLAMRIEKEHRRLAVIANPVSPAWKARFDSDGEVFRRFGTAVRSTLAETGAIYWDGEREIPMDPAAFTDAVHLRWSAAREFTVNFASSLGWFLGAAEQETVPSVGAEAADEKHSVAGP
jgi:hypothetical protein